MAIENDDVGPGWNAVQPNPKGGGKRINDGLSLFMRLEPREEPYHFRLACTPIKFRKHRWAFRTLKQFPISPATESSEKDLDIAWRVGKFQPVTRYAAFVFDRDNNNRLRILEECPDVYGTIGNDAQVTKTNPASATKGWDWIALVTEESVIENGKTRKVRKYQVAVDRNKGPTPLTEEEIKALDNPKFQREELEKRYFAKSTPEEIKDLWEQLPASARTNEPRDQGPKKEAPAAASQTVQASAKPATDETPKQEPTSAQPAEPKDDEVAEMSSQDDEESARMF